METVISKKKTSVSEYKNMPFEEDDPYYYEIIDGQMIQKSAPTPFHQAILKNLLFAIETFNRQRQLGKLFCAPIDVFLDEYNKPQPDLLFILERNKHIITDDGIAGTPDLIVEIISPSSVLRDRIEKKNIYERSMVPEFWLVDPQYASIEVYTLDDKKFELFNASTSLEGVFKSNLFSSLTLDLKAMFSIEF